MADAERGVGPLSAYEKQRLANIEANNEVLRSLGLTIIPQVAHQRMALKKKKPPAQKRPLDTTTNPSNKEEGPPPAKRTSRRLSGELAWCELPGEMQEESFEPQPLPKPTKPKPPDAFGEIAGYPVGSGWATRQACCDDLVHRATVAGIVGMPEAGCFSIVLSGGYADDVDLGEALTYTGSGGRSLKGTCANPKNLRTGPATKNQTLEGKEGRYNAALHKSFETGEPVRVVRGYKLDSNWAPLGLEYGGTANYRYDGLYKVSNAWLAPGLEGFKVWKFALKRLAGQPSLRLLAEEEEAAAAAEAKEEAEAEAEVEAETEAAEPRALMTGYAEGTLVQWREGSEWRAARIDNVNEDGTYDLVLDDGREEDGVAAESIRSPSAAA